MEATEPEPEPQEAQAMQRAVQTTTRATINGWEIRTERHTRGPFFVVDPFGGYMATCGTQDEAEALIKDVS